MTSSTEQALPMQDRKQRRRFIAGAVCPRCAEMDRVVVDLDTDQRECVSCGFSEARPSDTTALGFHGLNKRMQRLLHLLRFQNGSVVDHAYFRISRGSLA